jgi:hypothetical protein
MHKDSAKNPITATSKQTKSALNVLEIKPNG